MGLADTLKVNSFQGVAWRFVDSVAVDSSISANATKRRRQLLFDKDMSHPNVEKLLMPNLDVVIARVETVQTTSLDETNDRARPETRATDASHPAVGSHHTAQQPDLRLIVDQPAARPPGAAACSRIPPDAQYARLMGKDQLQRKHRAPWKLGKVSRVEDVPIDLWSGGRPSTAPPQRPTHTPSGTIARQSFGRWYMSPKKWNQVAQGQGEFDGIAPWLPKAPITQREQDIHQTIHSGHLITERFKAFIEENGHRMPTSLVTPAPPPPLRWKRPTAGQ